MRRITGAAALACVLAMACGDSPTAATEQEALTPSFDAAGNSGCYTVEVREVDDFVGPSELSGSLVGAGNYGNFGGQGLTGRAYHESYTGSWTITGGEIQALWGTTLDIVMKNAVTQLAPGQAATFPSRGTARIVDDDVEKGNLTYHGTFQFGVGLDLRYKGVICP